MNSNIAFIYKADYFKVRKTDRVGAEGTQTCWAQEAGKFPAAGDPPTWSCSLIVSMITLPRDLDSTV